MAAPFQYETDRTNVFEACLSQLFNWKGQLHLLNTSVFGNNWYARVDGGTGLDLLKALLREDKAELASNRDALMQVCRDYQMYIQMLADKERGGWLKLGAPAFLVAVISV